MEERTRFLANPDRYAPVNSGDDVVLSLDQGQSVPGHREHGVQFEGHVYLFASEATLDKFQSNRHYYADRALQAIRSTAQASAGH
jgi:YHS domain-containing protein